MVFLVTLSDLLFMRETVIFETPAIRATLFMLVRVYTPAKIFSLNLKNSIKSPKNIDEEL